ncbi:MAG: cell wall-associated protease [Solirubrobacteraceae bacterium]|jgi:subtilisin family serine protease|nr:cell wall-associated protease [Solirubrobacteraceae bacterium]
MGELRLVVSIALALALGAPAAHAAFPATAPNDPLYDASPVPGATGEQWDLTTDRGISVDRAWPLSTGAGTVIADLDLGVQLDHPDLAGRWAENAGETGRDAAGRDRRANGVDDDRDGYVDDWRGWDFYARDNDPTSDTANAHGTNVAGVLGAAADNGIGIAGVAPGARLLPLRTSDGILHQGARIAQAIVYATDRGAGAISMSLGADTFDGALRRAVAYAHRHGVVMAVASGNEFHFHHHQPQMLGDVLAVGGINPDSANTTAFREELAATGSDFTVHAAYADYGPHLDVVAPTQVPTTQWGGGYTRNWSGTSAATPHVAAVAALVQARGRANGLRLSAGEVNQIIRMSADDLSDPARGYAPGWDALSGWGRVNAYEAVRRAAPGRVPPVARITSPDVYRPARGRIDVRGAVSGRSAASWTLELGRGVQPAAWTTLATGRSTAARRGAPGPGDGPAGSEAGRLARIDVSRLAPGGWTLRLRARDAAGNPGEDRTYFTALDIRGLRPGFPRALGTSGESSPTLADVNGDGRADLVLATSDGLVRVHDGRTGRMLPGWPRAMVAIPGSEPVARRIGVLRAGFVGTPAVGDIDGDRRPDVVVGGLDGRVYAWNGRGRSLRGFPFGIGLRAPAEAGRLDSAIYASPALADLDRDGRLDVVVGAADQRVYALRGDGRALPGWPVLARDGGDVAKILASPAIGDLDGDGAPDVVEGTAEAYGSTPDTTGRVYAWDARGRRLPGWPVHPAAVAADSIPLVGEGVPVSPVLADVDGDRRDEVAVAAFTGMPELYRGDGTRMDGPGATGGHFATAGRGGASDAQAPSVLALGANAAFARLSPGGPLRFLSGLVDFRLAAAQQAPASSLLFEHLLGGWDARTGDWLPAFPRVMEGWQIVHAPVAADVDGDGRAEVLVGGSGNRLHAFREDGSEPAGWPRDTGGWLLASAAVGDVDGDGRAEVVAVTRDGWLFAWDTPAVAPGAGNKEWPAFRHDERNTGRYG